MQMAESCSIECDLTLTRMAGIMPDNLSSYDCHQSLPFQVPAIERCIPGFTGRILLLKGPGAVGVNDCDIGIGAGAKRTLLQPKDASGSSRELGDEVGSRNAPGMIKLH